MLKKSLRVSEFFRDFDPLRSGYISSKEYKNDPEFFKIILLNFGINYLLELFEPSS